MTLPYKRALKITAAAAVIAFLFFYWRLIIFLGALLIYYAWHALLRLV